MLGIEKKDMTELHISSSRSNSRILARIQLTATVLLEIAAIFVGLVCWRYLDRPMFANDFVWHEMALLPAWYPAISVDVDSEGIGAIADEHLNLIVIIYDTGNIKSPDRLNIIKSKDGLGGSTIRTRSTSDVYQIPRTSNTLLVFRHGSKVREFPLEAGMAAAFNRVAVEQTSSKLKLLAIDDF